MRTVTSLFAVVLIFSLAAFAAEVPLVASSLVPAAAGKLSYEHDRNGNIKYEVEVKHLAPPEQLTPGKSTYVVWVKPRDGQPQNAGVLRVNSDLEGSFKGTTPEKAFDLVVTAEDSPTVSQPTGPEILHGSVQVR